MWTIYSLVLFLLLKISTGGGDLEEEKYGVKYASTCEVCKVKLKKEPEEFMFKFIVITAALIGRGDRVQQQIIGEWEDPRCDRDRLQPYQVGKEINTCTLMRAPYILPLSDCWTLFTARRKRQSMWSPNSGWSRPWTGSATGSWRTTFIRCLEKHRNQLGRNIFPSFQERKDSTRFAKGQSETFSTLEGLVAKGVKVGLKSAVIGWK